MYLGGTVCDRIITYEKCWVSFWKVFVFLFSVYSIMSHFFCEDLPFLLSPWVIQSCFSFFFLFRVLPSIASLNLCSKHRCVRTCHLPVGWDIVSAKLAVTLPPWKASLMCRNIQVLASSPVWLCYQHTNLSKGGLNRIIFFILRQACVIGIWSWRSSAVWQ